MCALRRYEGASDKSRAARDYYFLHEWISLNRTCFCICPDIRNLYQEGPTGRSTKRRPGKKAARRVHRCTRLLLVNSTTYGIKISVGVIMGFRFMAGMVMVMRPVVTRVLMVVRLGEPAMGVLMEMFVHVLVGMGMGMLMAVRLAVMGMFVGVRMSMVMRVQMLVFVLSFHN